MNQYYLIAQLPSLDAIGENTPLPITEERFNELCTRLMDKKAVSTLNSITLSPKRTEKNVGDKLVDAWIKGEQELRIALASARASRMNKEFDIGDSEIPPQLMQTARAAANMKDPMAAELFLNRYRLDFLETLRPADPFSQSMVYYYGLKLKLIARIRNFDTERGEENYRNIYNSIMHREKQENIQ